MSVADQTPKTTDTASFAADAARLLAEAELALAEDRVADVPEQAVQDLLLAAVRLYAAKRDRGESFPAFGADHVTATDVAITCVAMTEVVNLELFELALWRGWSNV
jgi:hypothetical protein